MADYKRLVSYMYRYENKTKCNNVGYARIETRNGQCKITIHIRMTNYSDFPVKAYIYCWDGDEILGIELGQITVKNGNGDLKVTTVPGNVMESQYRLDEMSGIFVYFSDHLLIGTEWDDQLIANSKIRFVTQRVEHQKEEQKEDIEAAELTQMEEGIPVEEKERANTEDTVQVLINEEVEQFENVADESETAEKEITDGEETVEESEETSSEVSDARIEIAQMTEEEEQEAVEASREEENQTEQNDVAKESSDKEESLPHMDKVSMCESEQDAKAIREEIEFLKSRVTELEGVLDQYQLHIEELEKKELQEQEIRKGKNGIIERIFEKFPTIDPFQMKDIPSCVRIDLQDIGIFPMQNWILANNSFLLHGYYSYRHLIFARKNDKDKVQYFLGVPGRNQSRERFMADMFGFKTFQKASGEEDNTGDFGYWCLEIVF